MKSLPRFALAFLLSLGLILSGCPSVGGAPATAPGPTTSVVTPAVSPASWVNTAQTVVTILTWAVPAAGLVLNTVSLGMTPAQITVVQTDLTAISTGTLPKFAGALSTYQANVAACAADAGAAGCTSTCLVRDAGTLLVNSLLALDTGLGQAGLAEAAPIGSALTDVGGIVDDLTPQCVTGAGFTSIGPRISAQLSSHATLRAFPAIHPPQ